MLWARAEGCRVWDEGGREYLDLTGGFGVAVLGLRNPPIAEAIASAPVVHALGDLAEAEVTVLLRRALPWPAKFGVTGEDAVEIALRTALLATGKHGIVGFDGAYHGTGLLALAATGLERFRTPFAPWLPGPVHRRSFGEDPGPLPSDTAVVIVEPVQGRAGSRVPPTEFLATLRERCDEAGAILGFFAAFDGPRRAIECARTLVQDVRSLGLEIRAGLHTGECELMGKKPSGIAVPIGARVAAKAQPGEVLVSSTVKDLVAGSEITFEDRGLHELKGVGEWRLYAVSEHLVSE